MENELKTEEIFRIRKFCQIRIFSEMEMNGLNTFLLG